VPNGPDGGEIALKDLLLDPLRDPRPLLYGPGRLGIIWSAKSACTTLLLWYLWHCDLLSAARFYGNWPHEFRYRVLYASQTYRSWADQAGERGWSWLRVVRDPFTRAVSSYRHALRFGYEDAKMARVLARPVDCKDGFSFELFLDYLLRIDIAACNLHHRQQYHPIEGLVTPGEILNVDRENMMERLRRIDATFEAPKEPAAALSRAIAEITPYHHARASGVEGDQAATAFTARDASEAWPPHQAFLNDTTRARIAAIYAVDLARYAQYW
jgi:hypothetical protein